MSISKTFIDIFTDFHIDQNSWQIDQIWKEFLEGVNEFPILTKATKLVILRSYLLIKNLVNLFRSICFSRQYLSDDENNWIETVEA